jgi:hypothetical protein
MSHHNPSSEVVKDIRVLCMHVFDGGDSCASPALRGETFCYYHHPTRRPIRETRSAWRIARRNFSIPTPTTHEQCLDALTCILHAIADNRVKIPHARRILYSLQQVGINLQKVESASFHPTVSPAFDAPCVLAPHVRPASPHTTTSAPNRRLKIHRQTLPKRTRND